MDLIRSIIILMAYTFILPFISYAGDFDGSRLLSGSVEKVLEISQFRVSDDVDPDIVGLPRNFFIDIEEKTMHENILNESGNGLTNVTGSIAMARYEDPHSATRQFYFNMNNNTSLNPGSSNWGYTVFGTVVSGMDVLEAIAAVKTGYSEALDAEDVPMVPVLLIHARVQE